MPTQLINTIQSPTAFDWMLVVGNLDLFEVIWNIVCQYKELVRTLITTKSLRLAIIGGNPQIVEIFLRQVPFEHSVLRACYPLCIASACNNIQMAKFLIYNECDINEMNVDMETPILLAAKYDHKDMIEFLLGKKANVHVLDMKGFTPLMHAISYPICFDLLSAGSDMYMVTADGKTALMMALESGNIDTAKRILQCLQRSD